MLSLFSFWVLLSLTGIPTTPKPKHVAVPLLEGISSWYGGGKGDHGMHGKITADGSFFDPSKNTCAHRKIPLGTKIQVQDTLTGATATCIVNDRGPYGALLPSGEWVAMIKRKEGYFIRRRRGKRWIGAWKNAGKTPPATWRGVLDMSKATAQDLGWDLRKRGSGKVKIKVLRRPQN